MRDVFFTVPVYYVVRSSSFIFLLMAKTSIGYSYSCRGPMVIIYTTGETGALRIVMMPQVYVFGAVAGVPRTAVIFIWQKLHS